MMTSVRSEGDRAVDAGAAREKALELEVDVARRQAQMQTGTVAPTPQQLADYRARRKQLLSAQQAAADRGGEAADLRKQVASRRLKQLDALSKLMK